MGSRLAFYAVGLIAVLAYTNTLIGQFTFDDNFAVISNGDVTSDSNPISGLFQHDFWGQDITSQQSHKSYRPLTVLMFRWTRQVWSGLTVLAPGLDKLIPSAPPLILDNQQQRQELENYEPLDRPARPPGLHAFPFHVVSVVLHALVSMMVLGLAQHLFAKLELVTATAAASEPTAASAEHHHGCGSNSSTTGPARRSTPARLHGDDQPALWLQPRSQQRRWQAVLAALLFALHPIHTEAVAGIVGSAELLCAAWSIPALLLYFLAVDGRYAAAKRLEQQQQQHQHILQGSNRIFNGRAGRTVGSGSKGPQQVDQPNKVWADGSSNAAAQLTRLWRMDCLQHWLLVLGAATLALLAALSKEIGITIVGTMMLYDVLLAQHMLPEQLRLELQQHCATSSNGDIRSGSSGQPDASCRDVQKAASKQHQQVAAGSCRRQVLRLVLLAATAVGYVKLRQWVAVQQLVDIYRKVENPIPFAESSRTRVLTTGYLHARYFGLLMLPLHLSADWSFNCIPLLEQLDDVRNAATVALYVYIIFVGLSARPLKVLRQLLQVAQQALPSSSDSASAPAAPSAQPLAEPPTANTKQAAGGVAAAALDGNCAVPGCLKSSNAPPGLAAARWRLLVVLGLIVAPFFPASNVLFYVGTFIGERLLYFPSIGFCLVLAELLGRLLPSDLMAATNAASRAPQQSEIANADAAVNVPAAAGRSSASRCVFFLVVAAVLLVGYAGRTFVRNMDWWDEERLFLAALDVCPNSAKVQQNCGVLQRRYLNHVAALKHFRRAQAIEPGYCEPSYWIALTRINQGDLALGLAAMRNSLTCKYTAAEALQTLNKLYLMMHQTSPQDPGPMLEWAGVLASQPVLRLADACAAVEDAVLLAIGTGKSKNYINQAVDVCMEGISMWEQGSVMVDSLASLAFAKYNQQVNSTLLKLCVGLRHKVYRRLVKQDIRSQVAKRAIYRYIDQVDAQHPDCRTLQGGGNTGVDEGEASNLPSTHQKLLHRFQSSDPEDPWLQLEWGRTLIALRPQHNLREAARHFEVSSAIFSHLQQQLLLEQQQQRSASSEVSSKGGSSKTKQASKKRPGLSSLTGLTTLDGSTKLDSDSAFKAALLPLEYFRAAAVDTSDPGVRAVYCELLKRLCSLKLQMVVQVQQAAPKAEGAGGGGSGAGGGSGSSLHVKALLSAKAAARRCLTDLSEGQGCKQQTEDIMHMIGRD